MRVVQQGLVGLALVAAGVLGACRITPEEIQRIQVENQLLRREIQTVREKCDYYSRHLELEVDEGESPTE